MIEFSEKLDERYTGAVALQQRVKHRVLHEKYVVPYTDYGVDYALFTYSSEFSNTVQEVLRDLNVKASIDSGRLTVAGLVIDPKTLEVT